VITCPVAQRAAALRLLHAGLPTDQQVALVQALESLGQQADSALSGLLVAVSASEFVGAVWVQQTAGQTAVVWPTAADNPAGAELMCGVARWLDEQQVTLAQFLVGDPAALSEAHLAAGEFQQLASLAYLTADSRLFPTAHLESTLTFLPGASAEPQRLGELLLRTYEESLDCPELSGVRQADDILAGYREQGTFAPQHWFFVQEQQVDIGVLILTVHDSSNHWELVYIGLVPEVRGRNLGQQVVEFAMYQAGLAGAERLVLAVDQANRPAVEMYQRVGFVAWDHRTVYARLSQQE